MGIPAGLARRLRSGQTVLVAGLGFAETASGLTGAPAWEALLRRLCERYSSEGDDAQAAARVALDLVGRGRLRAALAWLRQRLPEHVVSEVLREVQPSGGNMPASVGLAARLPWRGVITTGFDDSWERSLPNGRDRGRSFRRLDARSLGEGSREDDNESPFFVHALGTPDAVEALCFSPADLRRRAAPSAVGAFLRSAFAERSFVFLGFGARDPDLALVLDMLGAAPTSAEHFFVYPGAAGDDEAVLAAGILGAELDFTAIPYGGSLHDLLADWVDVVSGEARARISRAMAVADDDEPGLELLPKTDHAEWLREQRGRIDTTPPGERAAIYERMGDVYRDKLASPVQAISCYRSAIQHEPARRPVLAKLADLYVAHKHWRAAEEALVKLAHTEQAPEGRARLLCRAAALAGEELDNAVRAAQLLERALDDAPGMVEAFEALERLLEQGRNWQALARLYQRTVRDLPTEPGGRLLKLRAATGLADLALKFSKDPKVALRALEAAEGLERGNVDRKALMAGLYEQAGPAHFDRAIAMHHEVIALDPERFVSYRALARIFQAMGDRDRLWCVAATLSFLRKGDETLRDIYERGKAYRVGPPAMSFTPELWSLARHPGEAALLTDIFAILGPALAGRIASTPAELGLAPEERIDIATDDRAVARAARRACAALGLPQVELYARPTERRGVSLRVLRARDGSLVPALLIGGQLLSKAEGGELTFALGRQVALLRPERIACGLEAGRDLARIALEAALYLCGLWAPTDRFRAEIEGLCGELRALVPAPAREAMSAAGSELLSASGGQLPDIDRWYSSVELSAARAAFLLVSDLGTAARGLAADSAEGQALPAKQRLKDLVSFSVSPGYFEARRALGLTGGEG
jgi:tetratricopeptide (TPR) repeat protein